MEPQLVIPIDAPPQIAGPWPRLLKMISLMVLLLCLTQFTGACRYIYLVLQPRPQTSRVLVVTGDRDEDIRTLIVGSAALVDLLLAAGAIILWKRSEPRLLIIALWLWFLPWAAGIVQQVFEFGLLGSLIHSTSTFYSIVYGCFPALVLLILREYAGHPPLPRNPLRLFVRWLID
jgi:hypothetical protein